MKIRISELRQLIREALEGEELALYIWRHPSYVKLVLYSPAELLALDWEDRFELPSEILKGYASFNQTDNPCNDAWQVSSIAGIGYGKLLYGLGYSLVPSGRLMPDRHFSSKRAVNAWTKSSGKMKGYPLDDVENPKTSKKEDDCEVQVSTSKGGPDPVLDVAYEGPKVDPTSMMSLHRKTVQELMYVLNDISDELMGPEEVENVLGDMLRKASTKYFTSEFGKYYKEK
jgi:hypothetical protein